MSLLAPRAPIRRTLRLLKPLAWAGLVVAALVLIVGVYVSIETNVLWFRSIGDSSVYLHRLKTEIVMFAIFGGGTAAILAVSTFYAARLAPSPAAVGVPSRLRDFWLRMTPRLRRLLLVAIPVIAGLKAGFRAAGQWMLWLEWRNPVKFDYTDPRFHRNADYYVDIYPFHVYVVRAVLSVLIIALVSTLAIAWLRGALSFRGDRPRVAPGLRADVSLLLVFLALAKAAAYWLNRFGTVVSSRGVVTGPSFVDLHVVIPDKLFLMIVALIAAAAFAVNVIRGSLLWLTAIIGAIAIAGVVAGGVLPTLVQSFRVKGAQLSKEETSIRRNIAATRFAFGLKGLTTTHPASVTPATSAATNATATSKSNAAAAAAAMNSVQARLIDPNVVSPTFTQKNQIESYYGFKNTLDVDRYDIDGKSIDEVVAVRELKLSGLPSKQKSWTDQHLVYTHGIGFVGAPMAAVAKHGLPRFNSAALAQEVKGTTDAADRIYFGQFSPNYSIVGAPPGKGIEFDEVGHAKGSDFSDPYGGGVPIGSTWHRLLYALKFRDKNILFSSAINPDSQLLYLRNPAARIKAVAPWLTLDGDVYPVVTDSGVTWIADGYTTSSMFPDSQETNLRSATATTYTKSGSTVKQPSRNINYIRNSVVATVSAESGAVTLYQKPGAANDPILDTWMKAFPGLVKPSDEIPPDLVPHLRYPTDLFNLQRSLLTKYHVTNAAEFFNGSQFWQVPGDPSAMKKGKSGSPQPSYYASAGTKANAPYLLTSPLLTLNGRNIAAYLSVDNNVGDPSYGRPVVTKVPPGDRIEAPTLIQNTIESKPAVSSILTLGRGGVSSVTVGNMQTILLGRTVLAIEPIYQQLAKGSRYPTLRHVVVVNGGRVGFASSYRAAIAQAFGLAPKGPSGAKLAGELQSLIAKIKAAEASGNNAALTNDIAALTKLDNQIKQQK